MKTQGHPYRTCLAATSPISYDKPNNHELIHSLNHHWGRGPHMKSITQNTKLVGESYNGCAVAKEKIYLCVHSGDV